MCLPGRFGIVRYGSRQRFRQPVNRPQRRAETGRHPRLRLRRNAPHQRAQPRAGAAAVIYVPHPQQLVPHIGNRIPAGPAGNRLRIRRPAVGAQRRPQPHIGDAARQKYGMAHRFVHGGLAQQRAGRRAVEIAGISLAVAVGARPVGQHSVRFRRRRIAQGRQVLAPHPAGRFQRRQNRAIVAKDDILNRAQATLGRGQKLPDVAGRNGVPLRQHRLNPFRLNRPPVHQRAGTPLHYRPEPHRLRPHPGRPRLPPRRPRAIQRRRRRVVAKDIQGVLEPIHPDGCRLEPGHNHRIGQVDQNFLPRSRRRGGGAGNPGHQPQQRGRND